MEGFILKKPFGVTFISYLYIFGVATLIATTFFFDQIAGEFKLAESFGLLNFPEELFRVLLAIVTLITIYGYMNLKPWGFWLMVAYCIGFGIISTLIVFSYNVQLFIGNSVWSAIVLFYSVAVQKAFFNEKGTQRINFAK